MFGPVQVIGGGAELGAQIEDRRDAGHVEVSLALKPGFRVKEYLTGRVGDLAGHLGHVGGDQVE